MQNDSQTIEVRRGFGLLFIGVSIAVSVASVMSEVASINKAPLYYYATIWFASFAITFGVIFSRFRKIIPSVRSRMKYSIKWSANAKALNGLCWAAPFVAIPLFPSLYQFLILLGIGLGNFSTYVLMKKYSRLDNREQLIVGLISLASIPIALEIDLTLFIARHDIAVMLSRILISTAYGTCGIYALLIKR